jgi:light-regulated signal transduction histidine kinase (bacteriophytochrome)
MEVSSVPAGADRERSVVNLEDVLEMVVRNLEALIRDSSAVITRDPLPKVLGHRVHLLQLLQNLVSNAIKYRGTEPPRIHISATRQDRFWRVAVRDNGIGIDPQHHQRVFGLFKRLHGRKFQGTGIGLSICQKVVERYGGRIWVESALGKGSTFVFTLPAAGSSKVE